MSYYVGICFDDEVLLASDRLSFQITNDGPKPNNASPKIAEINHKTAFLVCGNLLFTSAVCAVLKYKYPSKPIDLSEIEQWGEEYFTPRAPAFWQDIIKSDVELFKKLNLPIDSIQAKFLVGGIDASGSPYIISSDHRDFVLKILRKPSDYVRLETEAYILERADSAIKNFLEVVKGISQKDRRFLAKQEIPKIFKFVSDLNGFVGASGDILFVDKRGIERCAF